MTLLNVVYASNVQGYTYVVAIHQARYNDPFTSSIKIGPVPRHHYVDGGASTLIADTNCPHGLSVTKAASRVFTIGREVVRYCAAGAPRDWTTSSDAGFLPTTLQQDVQAWATAVGTYRESLVVFFDEGAQIWNVQVDPSANALTSRIQGVGTSYPYSLSSFYQDLAFVSPYGARSIAVQQFVQRIDENDIGVPVDTLITPARKLHDTQPSGAQVLGIWIQQFGQYWVCFDGGGFTVAYVYSFSRSTKLAAWSQYVFPVLFTGITTSGGKVYARSETTLYELDPAQYTDDGAAIEVDVQMSFQDSKLPGVDKMWYGADFVFAGTAEVSYLYDPRDTAKETVPQSVVGDTRPGQMVPVEVTCPALAPRFRHSANEAFSIDYVTIYFHALSSAV